MNKITCLMNKLFMPFLLLLTMKGYSQLPDHVFRPSIQSVTLTKYGDVYSYPILALNSGDQLELNFDDLDADVKNCYYSFLLCNADWRPSELQTFDYVRGFQSSRITTYRY